MEFWEKKVELRLPNRFKWKKRAWLFGGLTFILAITIVGLVIAPVFAILFLICFFAQFRYPVITVTCPNPLCEEKQKIEPEVTRFICHSCGEHLEVNQGKVTINWW